ncbi:MAG: MaoC family dehydratase [Burkholderiaceae bacterium]|nr:MaoC family dehydratase [Burkholderiaceae bacterium]
MAGLYYEEFVVGQVFKHPVTRTVTETDNLLFTALTHNTQPLHLDEEFAKTTPFGTRLVNSVFTLGLIVGLPVTELSLGTTLGNLGFEDVRFSAPVRIGDTLRSETLIVSKRESKKWPNAGIVNFVHTGYNQRNEVVATIGRVGLMMKRPVA